VREASARVDQLVYARGASASPTLRVAPSVTVSAVSRAPLHQKAVRLSTSEQPFPDLLTKWVRPAVAASSLTLCVGLSLRPVRLADIGVALIVAVVLISRLILGTPDTRSFRSLGTTFRAALQLLLEWGIVAGLVVILRASLDLGYLLPRNPMLVWIAVAPILLLLGDFATSLIANRNLTAKNRYIILGLTEVGVELARRMSQDARVGEFTGFFDFRHPDRLPENSGCRIAGNGEEVAAFVNANAINSIYIAMPISNVPRIEKLLQALRNTTASIFFVPDIFAFELMQARCIEMNGIPVLSICDTPYHGVNAIAKRATDIAFCGLALVLASPVMLVLAIAVKLSSKGPVLFTQRRYGLNGQEIMVFKFRTMTVCEDGPIVTQARKGDQRITPIGALLRRTSLDELPQMFNVLRGDMSLVGPRPHAVAHNEEYRRLIDGYMIRHKVNPGITGWAQIHGLRGETTTVEDMRARVQYDLDYLRNWSVWLDLQIMLRTVLIVIVGKNAY
jgi:putative colanic acid biosynthesis UDP-glucose lipid carrier transferase